MILPGIFHFAHTHIQMLLKTYFNIFSCLYIIMLYNNMNFFILIYTRFQFFQLKIWLLSLLKFGILLKHARKKKRQEHSAIIALLTKL